MRALKHGERVEGFFGGKWYGGSLIRINIDDDNIPRTAHILWDDNT